VTRAWILLLIVGCASPAASDAPMRVGTARAKITPAGPVMMAGYGARNKPSEGVAADLWARALAIDDGTGAPKVLVTADILGFGPTFSRALKAEARTRFGLTEERLLLVGSHTHSGPVVYHRPLSDPDQAKSRDATVAGLQETILRVIGEALGSASPARLEWARGTSTLGVNRRLPMPDGTWVIRENPEGKTDPDLPLMAVRAPDGQLRALFFTYACHCTTVRPGGEGFYLIHPDWAICCSILERKMPGTQVMFVTGCGADINPVPKGSVAEADRNGATMAATLESLLGSGSFRPVSGPIRAKFRRIELPLEKLDVAAVERMAATGKAAEKKAAEDLLLRRGKGASREGPVSFPIMTWAFGSEFTMVALAGETCVEYALRLKRELGAEKVWPVGYANEIMCYIPSERVLRENGYESGWSLAWGRGVATTQMATNGWDTPFAPGIEDRILDAVHQLMKE
jgi:hypothetical protein